MHHKEYFLPGKAAQGRGYLWPSLECVVTHSGHGSQVFPEYRNLFSPYYHQRMRAAHIHAGFYVGESKKQMGNYIPLILPGNRRARAHPKEILLQTPPGTAMLVFYLYWTTEGWRELLVQSKYYQITERFCFSSFSLLLKKIRLIRRQTCSDRKFLQFASQLWWPFPKSVFPCVLERDVCLQHSCSVD